MKICIVSSLGGHLTDVLFLKELYEKHEHFYVMNDHMILPKHMEGITYFVSHAERDLLVFFNLWEAWQILRKDSPDLIISAGAGIAVPFAIVGKLFRIPNIYIECSAQVISPSLSGRFMYYLADRFFYQWKPLGKFFPKGIYGGLVI